MKKMSIVLLSVMMMLTIVLSACSGNNKENNAGGNNGAANEGGNNQEAANGLNPVGEYPISKEKIKVKIAALQTPIIIDYATNEFTKFLEEKTNIEVEWVLVPEDGRVEKLNLMFASGDIPDAFFNLYIDSTMELKYGVEQGLLAPLDDLIGKTVNFKKLYEERQTEADAAIKATDGKIYTLPNFNECFQCQFGDRAFINQKWLDKLGLQQPTTTDELYNVLKAFKEKDPNGNGKQDEIPLAGAFLDGNGGNNMFMNWLTKSFLFTDLFSGQGLHVEDGKVIGGLTDDRLKEALRFMNKLYAEGLIYDASFTQKPEQLKQMLNGEEAIVGMFTSYGHVGEISSDSERFWEYEGLAPVAGPDGTRYAHYAPFGNFGMGAFAISSQSEHKEALIRWADYFFTFEGLMTMSTGPQGKETWEFAKEGDKNAKGEPATYWLYAPYSAEPQNKHWLNYGINYCPRECWEGLAVPGGTVPEKGTVDYVNVYLDFISEEKYAPYAPDPAKLSIMPPVKLTQEELDATSTIGTEIQKAALDYRIKAIVGSANLEGDWDAYVENLNNIGYQKFIEVHQTAYDRMFKI